MSFLLVVNCYGRDIRKNLVFCKTGIERHNRKNPYNQTKLTSLPEWLPEKSAKQELSILFNHFLHFAHFSLLFPSKEIFALSKM